MCIVYLGIDYMLMVNSVLSGQAIPRFGQGAYNHVGCTYSFAHSAPSWQSQVDTESALQIMKTQLATTPWLAGGDLPSIADIACYPYTGMCHEADLSFQGYCIH